ncbi:hypothetical protein AGMMS49950_03080 [Endomicrobiia bacterium]|nr:hypothetical protein AGMMS49531_03000 [Endomicrobiia bacterium]GHT69736.1 hypothetical protein AGMMS49950_03080 [Endomicrobiia bacterium]
MYRFIGFYDTYNVDTLSEYLANLCISCLCKQEVSVMLTVKLSPPKQAMSKPLKVVQLSYGNARKSRQHSAYKIHYNFV